MSILKVSVEQIKAARALLGWSQKDHAEQSMVSLPTIKRLEARGGELGGMPETSEKLQAALTDAGIIFIQENGEGPGVRLRKKVGDTYLIGGVHVVRKEGAQGFLGTTDRAVTIEGNIASIEIKTTEDLMAFFGLMPGRFVEIRINCLGTNKSISHQGTILERVATSPNSWRIQLRLDQIAQC